MMRNDSAFGVPSTVSKALPGNSMWIAPGSGLAPATAGASAAASLEIRTGHRRSRRKRRLHDPTLLIHSKTLPPTAFARTSCVQFHRSRINQSNPTNQTDSPDAYVR